MTDRACVPVYLCVIREKKMKQITASLLKCYVSRPSLSQLFPFEQLNVSTLS